VPGQDSDKPLASWIERRLASFQSVQAHLGDRVPLVPCLTSPVEFRARIAFAASRLACAFGHSKHRDIDP